MPNYTPALPPNEPDGMLLELLDLFERILVTAVELVALLSLCAWLIAGLGRLLSSSGDLMFPLDGLCALAVALCFHLSSHRNRARAPRAALWIAALVAILGACRAIACLLPASALPPALRSQPWQFAPADPAGMAAALAFTLLGAVYFLIHSRSRIASRIADALLMFLCFLTLVLVYASLLRYFGSAVGTSGIAIAPETLFALSALCLVAVLRPRPRGVFAVFLGRGIAGRMARFVAPILLLVPFLREGARFYLLGKAHIPPIYSSAVLASLATSLALAFLLYIARRIGRMESEIHTLSLRDELTGLNNLRGFRLLAEQALRVARRSNTPFSLLFIDLDNLKNINDSFGHAIGSRVLADTGAILIATFRQSDVLGRIGGDEFAVAGQFNQSAIAAAVRRLHDAVAELNTRNAAEPVLSLSLGRVTSEAHSSATLDELIEKADFAMYEEKRRKKSRAG